MGKAQLKHSFHTPKIFLAHQRPVLVRLVMVEVVVVVVPDGKIGACDQGWPPSSNNAEHDIALPPSAVARALEIREGLQP